MRAARALVQQSGVLFDCGCSRTSVVLVPYERISDAADADLGWREAAALWGVKARTAGPVASIGDAAVEAGKLDGHDW